MKKAKKVLLLVLCALLLVGASIAGTVAYLTSSAEVKNTFSVGNVEITMDEAKVNEYGQLLYKDGVDGTGNPKFTTESQGRELADRVDANTYKLVPGANYIKDPMITVTQGSEPCWVFIQVKNDIAAFEADTTIKDQILANGWLEKAAGVYYMKDVDARNAAVTLDTFADFTIKDDANKNDATKDAWAAVSNTTTITVTAYAVQADGVTTVDAAWAAVNP